MEKESKIYIAGHRGLVGSALKRKLEFEGYKNILGVPSDELDLRNQKDTEEFFSRTKPDYVFLAAARVGGVHANMTYPANFIYDNLQIQNNVIHSAYKARVKKLMYFGSCCAYPTMCSQPIEEEDIMTGKLEPTNEPFAIAKLAGIGLCQAYNRQYGTNFISVMPSNLFGPRDDFDPKNSHVVGMAMRLMHEAKENGLESVTLSGTGAPVRDFLYVDDLADACHYLMQVYDDSDIINIGNGKESGITKKEIALAIKEVVGFQGEIIFDSSKPDGMMKRVLDTSKINKLGWRARTDTKEALRTTYDWFKEHVGSF